MKKIIFVVFMGFIFIFVYFAHGQFGPSSRARFYSEFKPVVGGWSEYQIITKEEPASKMKIGVVGKEGDSYWYETVIETEREGRVITKMLVSGNPEDQKSVKRMIVKMGNDPAMEMPVGMIGQPPKTEEKPGRMIDKGTEIIKVPAGTFTVKHFQYQDPDGIVNIWVYKDISPYGMVKSQSKDYEMVLIGYGNDAKTLIKETPQKFEMPQIPQIPERLPRKR